MIPSIKQFNSWDLNRRIAFAESENETPVQPGIPGYLLYLPQDMGIRFETSITRQIIDAKAMKLGEALQSIKDTAIELEKLSISQMN